VESEPLRSILVVGVILAQSCLIAVCIRKWRERRRGRLFSAYLALGAALIMGVMAAMLATGESPLVDRLNFVVLGYTLAGVPLVFVETGAS
jgi:hypothetical protein